MKKKTQMLSLLALGVIGFLLRLAQQRIFEPETGLAIPGAPISIAMAVYLAAVGLLLFLRIFRSSKRNKLTLEEEFSTPPQKMLPVLVCAIFIMAAGGVLTAYDAFQGGETLMLILGILAAATALCLLAALTIWRRSGNCGAFLLAPAVMGVIWLLITYRQHADNPVFQALYVQILAISAFTYGFYQIAAYAYDAGSCRATTFILPAAIILGCTALADDLPLGLMALYIGCTVLLFGFALLHHGPQETPVTK